MAATVHGEGERHPPTSGISAAPAGTADSSVSLGKTFAALSVPAYRYLWASMLASFLGMQLQMVARGYLAYDIGNSAGSIAIVSIGWGIPMLFFSLIGGAVADRMDRRKLLILSQAGNAMVAMAIAALVETGYINLWYLFISGVVQGTIFSFSGPARQAFIPEIVGEKRLMNAIALNAAGMNLTRIAGPSLAGALIAIPWVNTGGVFLIQAGMNVIALLMLVAMPRGEPAQALLAADRTVDSLKPAQRRPERRMSRDVADGVRYVVGSPILLTLMMMGIVPLLIGGAYQSFLPVFAKDVFGHGVDNPEGLGVMMTVTGAGAVVGSLAVAALADFPRRTALQLVAGLGFGLGLAFFAVQHGFLLALLGLVVLGFSADFFASINATMVMSASDPNYYGRVMSVNMMTFSLMPLGTVPVGFLADVIGHLQLGPFGTLDGVQVTSFCAGVLILWFMLAITVFNPSYRRIEQDDLKRYAAVAAEKVSSST